MQDLPTYLKTYFCPDVENLVIFYVQIGKRQCAAFVAQDGKDGLGVVGFKKEKKTWQGIGSIGVKRRHGRNIAIAQARRWADRWVHINKQKAKVVRLNVE